MKFERENDNRYVWISLICCEFPFIFLDLPLAQINRCIIACKLLSSVLGKCHSRVEKVSFGFFDWMMFIWLQFLVCRCWFNSKTKSYDPIRICQSRMSNISMKANEFIAMFIDQRLSTIFHSTPAMIYCCFPDAYCTLHNVVFASDYYPTNTR